jgi:hypothetical protein
MKTSSAKAKGRRLQQSIAKQIAELLGLEYGKDQLVDSRTMGLSGKDVILIGEAKQRFPFDVEVKNQQTWSIPLWIQQSKSNTEPNREWLLVCAKNRHEPIAILDFKVFLDILQGKIKV